MPQITYTDWAKRTWKTYVNLIAPSETRDNKHRAHEKRRCSSSPHSGRRDHINNDHEYLNLEEYGRPTSRRRNLPDNENSDDTYMDFGQPIDFDDDVPGRSRRKVRIYDRLDIEAEEYSQYDDHYDPCYGSCYYTPYDSEDDSSYQSHSSSETTVESDNDLWRASSNHHEQFRKESTTVPSRRRHKPASRSQAPIAVKRTGHKHVRFILPDGRRTAPSKGKGSSTKSKRSSRGSGVKTGERVTIFRGKGRDVSAPATTPTRRTSSHKQDDTKPPSSRIRTTRTLSSSTYRSNSSNTHPRKRPPSFKPHTPSKSILKSPTKPSQNPNPSNAKDPSPRTPPSPFPQPPTPPPTLIAPATLPGSTLPHFYEETTPRHPRYSQDGLIPVEAPSGLIPIQTFGSVRISAIADQAPIQDLEAMRAIRERCVRSGPAMPSLEPWAEHEVWRDA